MAITDNVASKLLASDEVLQEQYMDELFEQEYRHGRTTNMIIPFSEEGEFEVNGDGINVHMERAFGDNFRPSTTAHSEFPTPRSSDYDKYKVRFAENGGSAMDFIKIHGSAQVSDLQMQTAGDAAVVDITERIVRDLMDDYHEKLAILRNIPRTGRLALVNGTPKQNDLHYYLDAAATASNTAGARFPVDSGSVARIRPGTRVDVYTGATSTRVAGNVEVEYVNTADGSVGLRFNTGTDDDSTGNLASVADNDSLYFSNSKDAGMYGPAAWFSRPVAAESFIAGRDRTDVGYRHMIIQATREGSTTTATIALSHFNQAARASKLKRDAKKNVVLVCDLEMADSLRSKFDDNMLIQQPAAGENKRFMELGAAGVAFQHPAWGRSVLMADPLMDPNQVRVIRPESWRSLCWGWRGLRHLPGIFGSWYRKNQATPNTGDSLIWKRDAYCFQADICLNAGDNVVITNVTP